MLPEVAFLCQSDKSREGSALSKDNGGDDVTNYVVEKRTPGGQWVKVHYFCLSPSQSKTFRSVHTVPHDYEESQYKTNETRELVVEEEDLSRSN